MVNRCLPASAASLLYNGFIISTLLMSGLQPASAMPTVILPRALTPLLSGAVKDTLSQAGQSLASGVNKIPAALNSAPSAISSLTSIPPSSGITVPGVTANDVFRYRFQYGANLGSVWVLERWLFPSMFPSGANADLTSELEAVRLWVKQIGVDATRAKFEQHWSNAISDDELKWIVNLGRVNTLRIPIGYFTLGPQFVKGTPFEDIGAVYQNAWASVKQTVTRAKQNGIGVLIDFHALPGGANTGDHSGTNAGVASLWGNTAFIALAKSGLEFLMKEVRSMEGIAGVQIVNEADYNSPGLYSFYESILSSFANIDNSIPIYISDGWDLPRAISYVKSKNTITSSANPLVIDTHLYWAFTEADRSKSPQQIIAEVPKTLSQLDGQDGNVASSGAVSVVVGEFSTVLDEASWSRSTGGTRQDLMFQFGQAQVNRYHSRASGSHFWTAKMDNNLHGGGWCFLEQSASGNIAPPLYMTIATNDVTLLKQNSVVLRDATLLTSLNERIAYKKSVSPTVNYDPSRYQAGWQVGFSDATSFFTIRVSGVLGNTAAGGDRIGLLDLWMRKRLIDSGLTGDAASEFEQGMRKGIADFNLITLTV